MSSTLSPGLDLPRRSRQHGATLTSVLGVTCLIGVMSAIAFPQIATPTNRIIAQEVETTAAVEINAAAASTFRTQPKHIDHAFPKAVKVASLIH